MTTTCKRKKTQNFTVWETWLYIFWWINSRLAGSLDPLSCLLFNYLCLTQCRLAGSGAFSQLEAVFAELEQYWPPLDLAVPMLWSKHLYSSHKFLLFIKSNNINLLNLSSVRSRLDFTFRMHWQRDTDLRVLPVCRSHSIMLVSSEPLYNKLPSGCHWTQFTPPLWPPSCQEEKNQLVVNNVSHYSPVKFRVHSSSESLSQWIKS